MNYYLHNLRKKVRIIKLNRTKYFLIPIKAKGGHWSEHPLVIVDEIMNGEDYFVGGMYATYQWGLVDQIPRQVDVYTTKKQGEMTVFNIKFIFHRTTKHNLENAVKRRIGNHSYFIANKKKAREWTK